MTREERAERLYELKRRQDFFYDADIALLIQLLEQEPKTDNIKALGEELRTVRGGIKDENVLIGYNMAVAICNKYLSDKEEPKTEWIPVSERLPKKNVEVLVTTEWGCITIGEMFSNNDWFIHEGATSTNIDDIKAWMPLPKPYQSEVVEDA